MAEVVHIEGQRRAVGLERACQEVEVRQQPSVPFARLQAALGLRPRRALSSAEASVVARKRLLIWLGAWAQCSRVELVPSAGDTGPPSPVSFPRWQSRQRACHGYSMPEGTLGSLASALARGETRLDAPFSGSTRQIGRRPTRNKTASIGKSRIVIHSYLCHRLEGEPQSRQSHDLRRGLEFQRSLGSNDWATGRLQQSGRMTKHQGQQNQRDVAAGPKKSAWPTARPSRSFFLPNKSRP